MGAFLSCNSSSTFKDVRVVHLNGYVEDFEQPISASKVIGYPPTHFVCTSTQLLSSSTKSMSGDAHLQPGQVYFMLPYSVLQGDVSPVDLTSLAKRLTKIAKSMPCEYNKSLKANSFSVQSQTAWSSPSRIPGRVGVAEQFGMSVLKGGRSPCRVQPWKPVLDTITEKPLNRRSGSDLQENY